MWRRTPSTQGVSPEDDGRTAASFGTSLASQQNRSNGSLFMINADKLAAAVGAEAANEMTSALGKIKHCLGQLSDEQVWRRSQPSLNSIGNLILHLCGNLRQWVVAGVGSASDVRNRPAEFAERGPIPKEELMRSLETVVEEAKHILAGVD